MERVVYSEKQSCANAPYSREDTIEVIGIPSFIRDQYLEEKVRNVFTVIGVNNNGRDIKACTDLARKTGQLQNLSKGRTGLIFLGLKRI